MAIFTGYRVFRSLYTVREEIEELLVASVSFHVIYHVPYHKELSCFWNILIPKIVICMWVYPLNEQAFLCPNYKIYVFQIRAYQLQLDLHA